MKINIERKNKFDQMYMNIAIEVSKMSYAERKKVGSVIVNDGNIISYGYNGTPSGFDNVCEIDNVTKNTVIHSELNSVLKAAKSGAKIDGSTLYLTLSPCHNCALLIIQSGIKKVIYLEEYRDREGIEILKKSGIYTKKLKM